MEFLPALSTWQWALVAAIGPAIVALYFLKLRRQPLEVPSTYLWRKSVEDLQVNSLWQRIRQNLLLYLQLLILLLVILALLRPGWHSQQLVGERNILLIDNSASMSAIDIAPSRLAETKRRALALIDDMQTADEREGSIRQSVAESSPRPAAGSYLAMVVSFSDTARVEQGWTSNLRELREAVARIQPTNRPTDISEALRVSSGLAMPPRNAGQGDNETAASPAKLFIFSDGRFPPVKDISLANLAPVLVSIGQAEAGNLGIIAFSVRRNESHAEQQQAFGSVANFGTEAVTVPIDLLLNGKLIDAAQLTIKPGETSGVSFNLGDTSTGILELRISREDALAVDNHAWAAINGSHRPKVLVVTPGNPALELAVSTPRAGELAVVSKAPPSILGTKQHQATAAAGEFDLIIYDRCQPTEMPHANTLFIGEVPPAPSEEGEQVAT
ncbi:MAG TPA: VWA domain-containing protein, partial [Pirellulales bacterium]